ASSENQRIEPVNVLVRDLVTRAILVLALLVDPELREVRDFGHERQIVATQTVTALPVVTVLVKPGDHSVEPHASFRFVGPDCSFNSAQPDFVNGLLPCLGVPLGTAVFLIRHLNTFPFCKREKASRTTQFKWPRLRNHGRSSLHLTGSFKGPCIKGAFAI